MLWRIMSVPVRHSVVLKDGKLKIIGLVCRDRVFTCLIWIRVTGYRFWGQACFCVIKYVTTESLFLYAERVAEYLSYSMSNCEDCLTGRSYPPPSNSTVIEPEGSIPATLRLLTGDYHELLKILFKSKTSEIRIITVLWHVLLQIGHTAQCLTVLCVLLTVLAVMRRSVGLLVVASMMLRNAENVFGIC